MPYKRIIVVVASSLIKVKYKEIIKRKADVAASNAPHFYYTLKPMKKFWKFEKMERKYERVKKVEKFR